MTYCNFIIKSLSAILFIAQLTFSASAQVGINTINVEDCAILQIESTTGGLKIPTLGSNVRITMNENSKYGHLAEALLVFDSVKMSFFYFDSLYSNLNNHFYGKWYNLNPFIADKTTGKTTLQDGLNIISYDSTKLKNSFINNGNWAIGANYAALAAPDSGAIIEGRVGIDTTSPNPNVALDVNGMLKVKGIAKTDCPTCNSTLVGAITFVTTDGCFYYCNGNDWEQIGNSAP